MFLVSSSSFAKLRGLARKDQRALSTTMKVNSKYRLTGKDRQVLSTDMKKIATAPNRKNGRTSAMVK